LEPATALTHRTSALAGVSGGPLVYALVGSPPSGGIFLATTQSSNQFPADSIGGQFATGDAVAATDTAPDGSVEIVHGIGSSGGVLITNQSGTSISPASLGFQGFVPYSRNGFLALGDVNGDGVADIVSTTQSSPTSANQVAVSLAKSAPPIPNTVTDQLTFPAGGALVVCDFDGDGVDDIIVAPSFTMYSGKTGTISQVPGTPPIFDLGDKLACGDLNGDGFEDLVIGHPSPNNPVNGLPGDGSFQVVSAPGRPPVGFFSTSPAIPLGSEDDLAAGDLDGDGVAELVVGHDAAGTGGAIFIFSVPGKTPPAPPLIGNFPVGSKVAVPKHTNAIPPTTTSDITIPYVVAYILYEPPGDKSVTDYITGTTLGSSETVTIKTSMGGSVEGKIPVVSKVVSVGAKATVEYSESSSTTHAFSTTETTEVLLSSSSGEDVPDHTFDEYVINFNIKGTVTDTHNGQPPTITLDMTSGKLVEGILAAYLQEIATSQPLTLVDPTVKAIVTGAIDTPEKAAGLLAMDPFFTGEDITQNPGRYVPFIPDGQTTNVVGLPHPTGTNADGGLPGARTHKYTGSRATSTTQSTGTEMKVTYNGSLTLFDAATLGGSYSVDNTDVKATLTTTTTGDAITLGTDHLCEQGDVALYQDLMFGGSFLTVQTLSNPCKPAMDAMSFETLAGWQVQNGGSATLSGVSVAGAASLSVSAAPGGWTPMVSIPFDSSVLREVAKSSDFSKVSFALNIPTQQPNRFWIGAAQMYVTSANANVFNAYMGQVELTGLPQGQFDRLEFNIPGYALPALAQDNTDVTFTIVLNVNAGTSGWLVDDLQIGS
jgi:hypothetical protein